jgi:alcohol dehydrogenase (cytochrome c)
MKGKSGEAWSGAHDNGFGRFDPKSNWGGYLTALNADSGKVQWKLRTSTPLISGVTPTAGGLLFSGDLNGRFNAYNARTGKRLWSDNTGQPMGGGVVTYQAGGRQYVAVAAAIKAPIWPIKAGTARIIIYGLR